MIIQTAPEGRPRFAIKMDEHSALSGAFAQNFGNDKFESADPIDLVVYVTANHDKGWFGYDSNPKTDPRTGFPYNLVETPADDITKTSAGSPDFNEQHHPYCGLLSSMHSWGLYNGRYGTSDYVLINTIPQQQRHLADKVLAGELERQKRLKAVLAGDPKTQSWIDERLLFQNYKRLQFFDTLALYFNRTHEAERAEMRFGHVPMNTRDDTTITIRPSKAGTYTVSPWPFAEKSPTFSFSGRYIRPLPPGASDWRPALAAAKTEQQEFTLVPE